MKPVILVVDDDSGVRYTLREILQESDMDVIEASDGLQALDVLAKTHADLIICDLAMPGMDGMELLGTLADMPQAPKTIMITAHGSEQRAVQAMKLGAYDYFAKPFDIDEVMSVVNRAVSFARMDQENEQLRAQLQLAKHMVFASDAMKHIALLVYRVASRDVTVLITGPSGTGKERVAQAIVAASKRAENPFVKFNCAAVTRDLADAELFGHAKGAFTGAVSSRLGLIREADKGTLLLDEIGEMDINTQGKLLRVLQEGKVRPVGEDREIAVDVRLIAATNSDLDEAVAAGRFREDLFYRLNVVRIHMPALSERPDDIPILIDHFLQKHSERFGLGQVVMPPFVRAKLASDHYSGNVRQLENRIERMVALSNNGVIDHELLDESFDQSQDEGLGLKQRVEAFERGLIIKAMRQCKGNRSEAARRLAIGRVTLLDKIKKYKLDGSG